MDDLLGDKVFWYGIFPFIAPSFASLVFIDSEVALGDLAVKIALVVFGVPMSIGFLLLNSRCLPRDLTLMFKAARVVVALFMAGTLSFASMGYVFLWNAITGSDGAIMVSGPILSMKAEGARWAGREYLVKIQHGERTVELSITPSEYSALKSGDTYSKAMRLGGLGYYYSWELAFWKESKERIKEAIKVGQ